MSESSVVEKPSADRRKPRVIRRLGHFERLMEAWTYCEQYCGTAITCRYVVPSELAGADQQSELENKLENVIAQAVLEHPLLQVGLAGKKSKKMAFVALDSIDMSHHVNWNILGAEQDYETVLQDHLRQGIDTKFTNMDTRPPWKITIFRPEGAGYIDLIFLFNHTIGDGTGGKIVHDTLLQILNTPATNGPAPDLSGHILKLAEQPAEYYTPPLDKMCQMPLTPKYMVSQAWESLRPPFMIPTSDTQAKWMPFRPGPAFTQRRTLFVDADRMETVLKSCRKHCTTVTGLLHGMMLVSLARQVKKEAAPAFRANSAVDLRRFVPDIAPGTGRKQKPFSTFANIVTSMDHDYSAALVADIRNSTQSESETKNLSEIENAVWMAALVIRHQLKERLEKGLKNEIIAMCKFVGDWRDEMMMWGKKPREISLHVSNIGVIDGAVGEGKWKLSRAMFSISAETAGPVISLGVMSLKGGMMCVEVTWQDGTIDNEMGERMTREIQDWFRDFTLDV